MEAPGAPRANGAPPDPEPETAAAMEVDGGGAEDEVGRETSADTPTRTPKHTPHTHTHMIAWPTD